MSEKSRDRLAGSGEALLRAWTRFAVRRAGLVAAASLIATALLAVYAARNLGMTTETENMIDDQLEWRQNFIHFRNTFPDRYRTIVVVISADSEHLADQGARRLDAQLERLPAQFASSYAPTAEEPLDGRELLFLDVQEVEALTDDLAAAQPFFGYLRNNYSLPGFLTLLGQIAERGESADSTAFIHRIGNVIDATASGTSRRLIWADWQQRETPAPARRLLVVKPILDSSKPRPAGAAMDALRALSERLETEFEHRLDIQLSGTIAMEDDEFVSVSRNARLTGMLALVGVMAILLVAFRSLRIFIVSIVTLLSGLIGTAAFAAWAVGNLNVISIAFAVLYIGLGIDFVIHYLLRVRELSAQGHDVPHALETASADVGGSLVICAVTTAVGFYSFIPTSFIGVSQLGLISGTGMFVSLAATLTLLPALLRLAFAEAVPAGAAAAQWAPGVRLARIIRYKKTILAIPVAGAFLSVLALPQLRFEADPLLLRDPSTESVRLFRDLNADPRTAPTSISVLVPAADDPDVLSSALAQLDTVDRVVWLASFAVDEPEEKLALLDDLTLMLGPSFGDYPALAAVDVAETRAAIAALRASIDDTTPGGMGELERTVSRLDARLNNATPAAQADLLTEIQYNLLSGLPEAMGFLAARVQPEPPAASAFPPAFADRWRTPDGAYLLDVIPAIDTTNPELAAEFVNEVNRIAPQATGLPVVFQRAGGTVVRAFSEAFLYAGGAIALLLLYFLRSFRDAALVLFPLALAAAIITGIMVLIDLPFNFANIIALPLLLGIGVDNGIHMVHRARSGHSAAKDILGTSTARAILFSSITTLASFGSLALSSHLGMSGMGVLLSIGLILILGVMLLLLPALLSWRTP